MGFFGAIWHKVEEVIGNVERTVGGAVGDTAMEFDGEAHYEHGEALFDKDIEEHEEAESERTAGPGSDQASGDTVGSAGDQTPEGTADTANK